MKPLDILYTPLDVPELPQVNLPNLMDWIHEFRDKQIIQQRYDASEEMSQEDYPWNIIYPRYRYNWYQNFNTLFPELAKYISTEFKVSIYEIQDVVLLPLKDNFFGTGFFHSDADECGIRFYIENNELNDFLLIRPTTKPFVSRSQTLNASVSDFQSVVHSAKMLRPKQAFFINNIRAIHAVNSTREDCTRIAVTITIPKLLKDMPSKLQDLIVSSAEKYNDYSIYWTPELVHPDGLEPPTFAV